MMPSTRNISVYTPGLDIWHKCINNRNSEMLIKAPIIEYQDKIYIIAEGNPGIYEIEPSTGDVRRLKLAYDNIKPAHNHRMFMFTPGVLTLLYQNIQYDIYLKNR